MRAIKLPRTVTGILIGSIILNAWLGYRTYRVEIQNRQAVAALAEGVTYRLTQLTPFAGEVPESQWSDVATRTWIYDSVEEIIDRGYAAERLPTVGKPSEVAHELGQLSRRFEVYRDDVHRLAFESSGSPSADRARIQALARTIRDAGWGPQKGPGSPTAWTYGRDWAELDRALDALLAAQW